MNETKTNQLAKKMTELCKQYARHSLPLMPQAFVAIIIGIWKGGGLYADKQRGWTGN
jgi:hypothetical protein